MNTAIVESSIEQLRRCVFAGIESWIQAGQIVVDLLDTQKVSVEQICKDIPGLSSDIIRRFEMIGRKQIFPRLLLSNTPGARSLASMPYSEQERFIDEPVKVLIETESGYDTLPIRVDNMTPVQARQVFGLRTIRDEGAQRAWLESEKRKARLSRDNSDVLPYTITGNKVVFRRGCIVTKREMQQILSVMKKG